MAIILSILSGGITAAMLFYLLFGDWEEFVECVRFWFTPELWSALKGEWHDDVWAEIKLLIFFGLSIAVGILTYVNIKP